MTERSSNRKAAGGKATKGKRTLNLTGMKRKLDLSVSSNASSTEVAVVEENLGSQVAEADVNLVPDTEPIASSVVNIPALLADFQAGDFGLGNIEFSSQTLTLDSWQL